MKKIVEKLKGKEYFHSLTGATEAEIRASEQALGLTFAEDYRDYLKEFGLASYQGHELTGLINSPRLNVVTQTLEERRNNPHIANDLYVIEVANIDGIIIWQTSTGEIFETVYDSVPTLIHQSLYDYI